MKPLVPRLSNHYHFNHTIVIQKLTACYHEDEVVHHWLKGARTEMEDLM